MNWFVYRRLVACAFVAFVMAVSCSAVHAGDTMRVRMTMWSLRVLFNNDDPPIDGDPADEAWVAIGGKYFRNDGSEQNIEMTLGKFELHQGESARDKGIFDFNFQDGEKVELTLHYIEEDSGGAAQFAKVASGLVSGTSKDPLIGAAAAVVNFGMNFIQDDDMGIAALTIERRGNQVHVFWTNRLNCQFSKNGGGFSSAMIEDALNSGAHWWRNVYMDRGNDGRWESILLFQIN